MGPAGWAARGARAARLKLHEPEGVLMPSCATKLLRRPLTRCWAARAKPLGDLGSALI